MSLGVTFENDTTPNNESADTTIAFVRSSSDNLIQQPDDLGNAYYQKNND